MKRTNQRETTETQTLPTGLPLTFGHRVDMALALLSGKPDRVERVQTELNTLKSPFNASMGDESHWRSIGGRVDYGRVPGSAVNWEEKAGDLWLNSTIGIGLSWFRSALLEAPCGVYKDANVTDELSGETKPVPMPVPPEVSLFSALLAKPNNLYSSTTLWAGTVLSYKTDGNAFWYKERILGPGTNSPVIGLWYLPHFLIEPFMKDGMIHYRFFNGKNPIIFTASDIIHFRDGIDPRNMLRGISPLRSCLRSVVADNEADTYITALLLNMGIPGAILSPDDPDIVVDKDKRDEIKEQWRSLTGDHRGNILVSPVKIKIDPAAFNPEELMLDKIRSIPVSVICAALGASPMVFGLPDPSKTYTNYGEANSQAWQNAAVPMMKILASDLNGHSQELGGRPEEYACFCLENVLALQGDNKTKAETQKLQAETVKILVDTGYDPEQSLLLVGFPRLKYEKPEPKPLPGEVPPKPKDKGLGTSDGLGWEDERLIPESGPYLIEPDPYRVKDARSETTATLHRVLQEFRSRLRDGEVEAVQELLLRYRLASTYINGLLLALLTDIDRMVSAGETVPEIRRRTVERYNSLLSQIDTELGNFATTGSLTLTSGQQTAVLSSLDTSHRLLSVSVGPIPAGATQEQIREALKVRESFTRVRFNDVVNFLGFAGDGSPLADVLRDAVESLPIDIRQDIVDGIVEGESAERIGKRIARTYNLKEPRLTTICRTEILRAARETALQTYQDNGDVVESWVWMAARDGRSCACCWAMHGTKHKTGIKMGTHPQCRCTLVPYTKSWGEILGDTSLKDTRPQYETGEELFRRLNPEKQKTILGEGGYKLYRAGTPLSAFVHEENNPRWGTVRRVSTLQEIEARQ